jgi:large subunit ribosomal protein L31
MKKDIHPQYQDITFNCACGAKYLIGSTIKKEFNTEICSNCHPFYTGKQKLLDSSGRVDKFRAKMQKAQDLAEKKVKKVKKGEEEIVTKLTAEDSEKKEKKTVKKEVKTPKTTKSTKTTRVKKEKKDQSQLPLD